MRCLPKFWKCGGGPLPYKYGFGYWVKDVEFPNDGWMDLLCVNKNPKNPELELSPVCANRIKAMIGFIIKRWRIRKGADNFEKSREYN